MAAKNQAMFSGSGDNTALSSHGPSKLSKHSTVLVAALLKSLSYIPPRTHTWLGLNKETAAEAKRGAGREGPALLLFR